MSTQSPTTLSDFSTSWNHEGSWANAFGKPVDDAWLQQKIDLLAEHVSTLPRKRGGNHVEPLADLAKSTMSVLGGRVSPPLRDLLAHCIEHDYPLPAIRRKLDDDAEPCGPIIVSHNLSPEWIRHFLGAFYSRKEFEKALAGRKFFPYENRDHLVHTLICSFIGEVALGIPIEQRFKDAIASIQTSEDFRPPKNLFEALVEVYRSQHPNWFNDPMLVTEPEVWLRRAWLAASLWHDAGYDTATWYLLTSREFQHCEAVDRIKPAFQQCFADILGQLSSEIGALLPPRLLEAIQKAQQAFRARKRPYEILWHLEGCHEQDPRTRPWGRLHALLSAHEFLNFIDDSERQREDVKHIAAAIAEHHEQVNLSADRLDWEGLWAHFLRNPLAALLAFADFLAGFERVKVAEASPFIMSDIGNSTGRMSFDFDINSAPLWITQAQNLGYRFFRGRQNQRRIPDRYSLWALIDKADDNPPKRPSPLKESHCTNGGCRNVAC
jgi:hypothetical protein